MADLGRIIRRAQAVDATPPQRVVASGSTDKPNIVLVLGKSAGVKSLGGSFSFSTTTYMEKQQKEIERPSS